MKNHQNVPPTGNHNPPPPPEKHHKKEKRRRRGPSVGFIILLLLVLAIAALVALWKLGYIHFGKDSGDGGDGSGGSSVVSGTDTSNSSDAESTVIEIRVDQETIYFDGAELASANELKDKITEIGTKKSYNFVHDSAIKATYDEVKSVLNELETALNIKVNYNDD